MKQGLNEACARYLILTQVASDGGKCIDDIINILPGSIGAYHRGYKAKDEYLSKFLSLVTKVGPASGFHFYVTDGDITPHLVFVWFRLNGRKRQVSFHSYDDALLKYKTHDRRRYATHWDKLHGSREACIDLANTIFYE